jgi:hypothetical protein
MARTRHTTAQYHLLLPSSLKLVLAHLLVMRDPTSGPNYSDYTLARAD